MKRGARDLACWPLSNLFHKGANSSPARETWGRPWQMATNLLTGRFFCRLFLWECDCWKI